MARLGWPVPTTTSTLTNTSRKRGNDASDFRSAKAVVGLGRWEDRFATYDDNYYSYLPLYNPLLFGGGGGKGGALYSWGKLRLRRAIVDGSTRVDYCSGDGGDKGGEFAASSGEEQRQTFHKGEDNCVRLGWGRKRRNRPSEASVQAVWGMVFLVQQQLLLASNVTIEEQEQDEEEEWNDDEKINELVDDEGEDVGGHQRLKYSLLVGSEASIEPSVVARSSSLRGTTADLDGEPKMVAASVGGAGDDRHQDGDSTTVRLPRSTTCPARVYRQSVVYGRSYTSSAEDLVGALPEGSRAENCYDVHHTRHAEVAARLAEGALRAYRDLALDEATELHDALHHWTVRWLHPLLAWLEAGPVAWWDYSRCLPPHLAAGRNVSQIQAVLARRCAVIGELQQHLWRANWRKGVAAWGMLGGGVGGEWTSAVGEFNSMDACHSGTVPPSPSMKIFNHSHLIGTNVSNLPGGSIVVDQEALVTWSIDAMQLVRDHLYRARQGLEELPLVENWPREMRHFRGSNGGDNTNDLPLWASSSVSVGQVVSEASAGEIINFVHDNHPSYIISDLSKMTNEVSALLQSIEVHLEEQRDRRLDRLRPPSRLRRNWYLIALGVPVGAYGVYKLTREHGGRYLLTTFTTKIANIYRDHVSEPLNSIYQELFTKSGRMNVTDRKARVDTIESLKRMIRSWLEESFPDMPLKEMQKRAEVSL